VGGDEEMLTPQRVGGETISTEAPIPVSGLLRSNNKQRGEQGDSEPLYYYNLARIHKKVKDGSAPV